LKRKCILMSKMKAYKVSQSKEDFEGNYELWKLKIGGAFSKHVFWACNVKGVPIWYNK
jgi:hypothetical protein